MKKKLTKKKNQQKKTKKEKHNKTTWPKLPAKSTKKGKVEDMLWLEFITGKCKQRRYCRGTKYWPFNKNNNSKISLEQEK